MRYMMIRLNELKGYYTEQKDVDMKSDLKGDSNVEAEDEFYEQRNPPAADALPVKHQAHLVPRQDETHPSSLADGCPSATDNSVSPKLTQVPSRQTSFMRGRQNSSRFIGLRS